MVDDLLEDVCHLPTQTTKVLLQVFDTTAETRTIRNRDLPGSGASLEVVTLFSMLLPRISVMHKDGVSGGCWVGPTK